MKDTDTAFERRTPSGCRNAAFLMTVLIAAEGVLWTTSLFTRYNALGIDLLSVRHITLLRLFEQKSCACEDRPRNSLIQ